MRRALERGEFVLHYQPKVDLKTRRVTGVEALVRWQHPEHGLLAPPSFIPLIEPTALVGPFTLHVIDARAAGRWSPGARAASTCRCRSTCPPATCSTPSCPAKVAELLQLHAIPAERLTLEVTESAALVDPERAVAVLEALRASGIEVSVDDFGTGNASIEYLSTLPASEIKIDRSFITGILEDPRADAIVRSTLDLARNLGLTVVAEGIETEAEMEHLTALGCETGQGYFFSRPLPAEELAAQLGASVRVRRAPNFSARAAPGARCTGGLSGGRRRARRLEHAMGAVVEHDHAAVAGATPARGAGPLSRAAFARISASSALGASAVDLHDAGERRRAAGGVEQMMRRAAVRRRSSCAGRCRSSPRRCARA